MCIECTLGDLTSNAHSMWIESTSTQSTSRGGLRWIEHLAHTKPHTTAIHVMCRAFIGLSVPVYLNLEVFGSVIAASWSNEATRVLITVRLYIKFYDIRTYVPTELTFPS